VHTGLKNNYIYILYLQPNGLIPVSKLAAFIFSTSSILLSTEFSGNTKGNLYEIVEKKYYTSCSFVLHSIKKVFLCFYLKKYFC